ncbi:MAG: flagellar hook-basal body complex protein FliE [Polycyclovorans sp.]|jgi:flagellar hook-basal body complex protein FliE
MSITGATSAASMSHATLVGARPGPAETPQPPGNSAGPDFSKRIGEALESVNTQQTKANEAARDFETGKTDDLAAVMVEQQVASLGFQMTLQTRNKALTAYRDIMNMPV